MEEKQGNDDQNQSLGSQRAGGRNHRRGHRHHWHSHRRDQNYPSAPPMADEFEDCCSSEKPAPSAPSQQEKHDGKEDGSGQKDCRKHSGKFHRSRNRLPRDNFQDVDECAKGKEVAEEGIGQENRRPQSLEQRRPYRFHGSHYPRKQWHKEHHHGQDVHQAQEHERQEGEVDKLSLDSSKGAIGGTEDGELHDHFKSGQTFQSYHNSGYRGYRVREHPSYSRQDCRSKQQPGYSAYQRRDWGREGHFVQLDDSAQDEMGDMYEYKHGHHRGGGSRSYYRRSNNDGRGSNRLERDHRKQKDEKRRNHSRRNQNSNAKLEEIDDETQRERLTEQLCKGEYECIVCCELVRRRDSTWNCCSCYHIFHLGCIRKWACSPAATAGSENGWRCPTCQSTTSAIPSHYYCFCGKTRDPERSRHDTPHSCGDPCNKERTCKHRCNLLCHPGPCPPCSATVFRSCPCGHVQMQVLCSRTSSLACGQPCKKILNCGVHPCPESCHDGPCPPCAETITRECYCCKVTQSEACTAESNSNPSFGCGQPCGRLLGCGRHECSKACHSGSCPLCPTLPELVETCPCGKTALVDLCGENVRRQCTDPIPTCVTLCGKLLSCGPIDGRHACASRCHYGDCPPCSLRTSLKCCCGSSTRDVPCPELATLGVLRCEKRCSKKRQCGRHKCVNTCCVDVEHLCDLVCNQKLSCGLHSCQDTCHNGNCKTCWNVSFEELTCHCGAAVIYPPIPCGTKPPECQQKCGRAHPCDHPVQHNCHSEENCPPCTALTSKWCYGGHELRKTIPCYQEGFSCGLQCSKSLPCGQHRCQLTCHQDSCQKECQQPCPNPRQECTHSCAAPCHQGPCPEKNLPCRALVTLTCVCGTRSERIPCGDSTKTFQKMSASLLASKMQDIQSGNSVDISDVFSSGKKTKPHRLECNDECALVDRNRRLALALQIRNPDLAGKPGPPNYSEFLKEEARKNPQSVGSVFDKLTDLVQLAKQSKQKSRSHSFPPMNREMRRVVHELAAFFGCETESYDQEPKRNIVATAFRDRSYLPTLSVTAVVQREMGQRKAPKPVTVAAQNGKPEVRPKAIDYFDFPSDV